MRISKRTTLRNLAGPLRLRVPLVCLGLLCGCASKPPVSTESAYERLEPKEQLPERERQEQPDNFIVRVLNVADNQHSYKNYVVLFVNDQRVEALGAHNMSSRYVYSMRLREGVYDVRAEYHSVGGWAERVYKILPDEPVKVLPDQRTTLEVKLRKDQHGEPTQKPLHFTLRYEPEPGASVPTALPE